MIAGINPAIEIDHTIAKARCKQLGKTELIWDRDNTSDSCRECHEEWERYANGAFEDHKNVVVRMKFMKIHDPERYEKRFQRLSNYKLIKKLI